jgi:hypothetical protein
MPRKQKRKQRKIRAQPTVSSGYDARQALNTRQLTLIFVCTALAVTMFLHFSVDKFPDPDGFYHFRHAQIYGSASGGGIFRTDFPWAHHSVIRKLSSDLWYGFHVLLIPFTLGDDPILGMRLAGILVTFLFLISFYAACIRLKIKPALFWPFFLLFSSAFLLHRLGMLRPHVLSLGLSCLLFAFLASESIWGVFFAALISTFLHLNLFFISLSVVGVFTIVKIFQEKLFSWRECVALVSGVLLGWLLRPNPVGAASILYTQLFQFTSEKIAGSPLEFGAEMSPLTLKASSNYLFFTLLLLFSLSCVFWQLFKKGPALSGRDRTTLISLTSLSIIFFLLSVLFIRRAFDFCSAFGVLLMGFVFSHYFHKNWLARAFLICAFVVLVPYGYNLRNRVVAVGWNPNRFESAAKWIANNSNPGEIVFNARWEYFAELFFWNTKNVYSNGMDPIFQYAYDPALYQEGHDLTTGQMHSQGLKDPYIILKENFKARYVFLAKPFDGSLYFRLSRDSRFLLKQENGNSAVFEIN